MIEKMSINAKRYLPLNIKEVIWDGTTFHIWSDSWSFVTLGSWRISTLKNVILGCYDDDSIIAANNIKGLSIIDIKYQEDILKIDPVFILSNGWRLEIFATDTFESWTFNIDEIGMYIGTPKEPEVFDPD